MHNGQFALDRTVQDDPGAVQTIDKELVHKRFEPIPDIDRLTNGAQNRLADCKTDYGYHVHLPGLPQFILDILDSHRHSPLPLRLWPCLLSGGTPLPR